jgi:Domain of unknown function (DUF4337)
MSGHGHAPEGGSKKTALLISIIALLLAFAEHGVNDMTSKANSKNIEASNLWAFFQAKTIRRTNLQTNAESLEAVALIVQDPAIKEGILKKAENAKKGADRMESEPETREGRRELMARALQAEKDRDAYFLKKAHLDIATGIFQVAIVLASAAIITGMVWMLWITSGASIIGFILMILASKLPSLLAPFLKV